MRFVCLLAFPVNGGIGYFHSTIFYFTLNTLVLIVTLATVPVSFYVKYLIVLHKERLSAVKDAERQHFQ